MDTSTGENDKRLKLIELQHKLLAENELAMCPDCGAT